MPWKVTQNHPSCPASRPFGVVKTTNNELEGCHGTQAGANRQMAALYASEDDMNTQHEGTRLGAFVMRRRKERNMTAAELGQRINRDESTVRNIESGNIIRPPDEVLGQLARALGASLSQLQSLADRDRSSEKSPTSETLQPQHIVESVSTDVEISESEQDDNIIAHARFQISEINKRNRNGRVYPKEVWEQQVSRFTKGSVTGQDGHPGPFDTPKITDAFLIFNSLEIHGDKVFAEADVINTDRGRDFVAVAKAGAKIADSTRGFGTLERKEKWDDGKPAMLVKDDFRLLGIDVMFDNYQSVPGAKMQNIVPESIHFIHEDWNNMENEITIEWLQENHSDVYEEITESFAGEVQSLTEQNQSLTEEVADLTEQVQDLSSKLKAASTVADELKDELVEQVDALETANTKLEEATSSLEEATEAIKQLKETKQLVEDRVETLEYIHERVVGEPAALLMLRELSRYSTKDEVRENFLRIKREAEAMLASLAPQGKSVHVYQETDQNVPLTIDPEARRYRNLTGLSPVA